MGGRPLIVLDLNGTLLQRLDCIKTLAKLKKQVPSLKALANVHGRPIVARPGSTGFLEELLQLADLAVWTSAQSKNAVPMVMLAFGGLLRESFWSFEGVNDGAEHLEELKRCVQCFKDRRDFPKTYGQNRLVFLWTQTQCHVVGHEIGTRGKGDRRPIFAKDLARIWQSFPDLYSPANTIMIDDSEKKIPKALRGNLLRIPEFNLEKCLLGVLSDVTLERLAEYLREALKRNPTDFRTYMSENPFNR